MCYAAVNVSALPDALAIIGSAGTVLGGAIGAIAGSSNWRQAFECLALGAAAGGVSGCLAVFVTYLAARTLGW
jgi:hypothetical protein